jgi:CO/xanthine dehydrogenase Mo-binding subunit
MKTLKRRDFLKTAGSMAGVIVVGFSTRGVAEFAAQAPGFNGTGSNALDSWLSIASDGGVTVYTGKCELGTGLYTAQVQLIAEELSVSLNRVKLIQCDTELTPDQGTTSGAQSHPTNFNQANLAQACATAREALKKLASTRLAVSADQLDIKDGVVSVKSNASQRVTYGELIGGKKFNLALDTAAKRKPASEWTILGKPIPRFDIPAMATGQFEYVHNVRVAGMLHGQVVRPPSIGASVKSVDESSVKNLPGAVKVVVKKNFVGVVAEKPWQALQAAAKLKVEWTAGTALPNQAGFHDFMRNQTQTRDTFQVKAKDVDEKLSAASKVVKATYRYPYQMHGSFASSCAVADVQSGSATIWSATQAVFPLRSSAAMVLGLRAQDVHVIFKMGSGCYGCNSADTVSYDAAILSQAVGKPVRMQLSRKDEMISENYGYAFLLEEKAGVGADGTILAWDHEAWSPVYGNRPGANQPGNVLTGLLAGFEPAAFAERSPAPEPANFANNSNATPSYYRGGTGTVSSVRVLTHNIRSPFFTGPLRSPERLQNTFAHESFMDEIAAAVAADPVAHRLKHLSDARLIDVVKAAAKAANWDTRPSPKSGNRRTGIASGRGISCVLYEGDNGYCAMVAEVDVNQDTGVVSVRRLVIAEDCGPISNPDGLRNQLEGAALQGMSRALLEEVTWDNSKITSIDWRTYHPLFLGADIPKIETVLLNRTDVRANGAGETAVTVAPAAIANAIFDATGARVRDVPFTPERVKAALAARA